MRKIIFIFIFTLGLVAKIDGFAAEPSSNITIKNSSGSTTYHLTGIYVQQLATGTSCSALAGHSNTPSHGFSYGAFWTPRTLAAGESYVLGANSLYQMMTQLLFQTYLNSGNYCTPGVGKCGSSDEPDTNHWCIELGVVQGTPVGTPGAISSSNDLLSFAHANPIKITCDDAATTCIAYSPLTQNFP